MMRTRAKCARAMLPLLAVLWSATGCRQQIRDELLERDLRWQEDEIYFLEDKLDDVCDQLSSCRRENESLRAELEGLRDKGDSPSPPRRARPPAEIPALTPEVDLGRPSEALPPLLRDADRPGSSAPPFDGPPLIDPLPPDGPTPSGAQPEELPQGYSDPQEDAPRFGRRTSAIEPLPARQVAQITLNRMMTGGHDMDGHPGDEGVIVVIEPRDPKGQVVAARGRVSLVVLDPAEAGAAARVARWDFTAAEAAGRFRQGVFGKGLKFDLPWPHEPPRHTSLRLFVRFTTEDGHTLQAEKPIDVELLPKSSREWTAASPHVPR